MKIALLSQFEKNKDKVFVCFLFMNPEISAGDIPGVCGLSRRWERAINDQSESQGDSTDDLATGT